MLAAAAFIGGTDLAKAVTTYDPPADALYGSVMQEMKVADTWIQELPKGEG